MAAVTTKIMTDLMVYLLRQRGYVVETELRVMTGGNSRNNGEQRIDVWAIHPYPSKGLLTIALEVKASRSDWLNELKKPRKRNYAILYSNEFYIVAAPNVVKLDELPKDMGLVTVYPLAERPRFSVDNLGDLAGCDVDRAFDSLITVKAPYRDRHPPTWPFVASLVRRLQAHGAASE